MAWKKFPYPDNAYVYTPLSLETAWQRLHAGDAEPFPAQAALVQAWIAYHAGDFERAAKLGLAVGVPGYSVAHKATCMHATHLELDEAPGWRCSRKWPSAANASRPSSPTIRPAFTGMPTAWAAMRWAFRWSRRWPRAWAPRCATA